MDQVQETTTITTTAPTVSRTIRLGEGDYNISINHGVSTSDTGRRFLTFTTTDEAHTAFDELRAAGIKSSYISYSLFVKSQPELVEDTLKASVVALVPDANVTYVRVDDNKHTGKVVVDLLGDYQSIKSSSGTDLRFFHFDPKRIRNDTRTPRTDGPDTRPPRTFGQGGRGRGRGGGQDSRPPRTFGQGGRGGQDSRPPRTFGQGGRGGQDSRPPRTFGQGGRGGQDTRPPRTYNNAPSPSPSPSSNTNAV